MVDVLLMQALLKAFTDNAALAHRGGHRPAAVGRPGQVLADIIGSGAMPAVRLTEVFRQAAASRIIVNAHGSIGGLMPELGSALPATAISISCPRTIRKRRSREYWSWSRPASPNGSGSIHPGRPGSLPDEPGGVGARSLNIELQAVPQSGRRAESRALRLDLRPGDKVMQIENDYDKEVYNGDIGYRRRRRSGGWRSHGELRRAVGHLRIRRTEHPGSGLRRDHPQSQGSEYPR